MDTNIIIVAQRNYILHQAREGHILITIPSLWVRAFKLEKGDRVTIQILSDGSLRIVPLKNDQNEPPSASPKALSEVAPDSKEKASS
jgi:bifunctional DNA-binding transcriptional regulator/antitoxin component of YhaV-PrlF toxin-antitoxin module